MTRLSTLRILTFHKRCMETTTTHKPISEHVIPDRVTTSSSTVNEQELISTIPETTFPIITQSPIITEATIPVVPQSPVPVTQSPISQAPISESPIAVPQASSRHQIKEDDNEEDINPELGSEESINEILSGLPLAEKNRIIKDIEKKRNEQEILARELREELNTRSKDSNYPDDQITQPIPTLYTAPILSREALLTDVVFRTFITNINEISDKIGFQINQSIELAQEWVAHIAKLDQYIKSLSSWKKTLAYSLCLVTIGTFLWRMGALRAIPHFLSNAISIIPMPTPTITSKVINNVEVPTPNLESTYKAIMETPITPIVLVSSIGAITTVVGIMRVVAWMLRKLPK